MIEILKSRVEELEEALKKGTAEFSEMVESGKAKLNTINGQLAEARLILAKAVEEEAVTPEVIPAEFDEVSGVELKKSPEVLEGVVV